MLPPSVDQFFVVEVNLKGFKFLMIYFFFKLYPERSSRSILILHQKNVYLPWGFSQDLKFQIEAKLADASGHFLFFFLAYTKTLLQNREGIWK